MNELTWIGLKGIKLVLLPIYLLKIVICIHMYDHYSWQ